MTKVFLALHVVAAILAVGPVAVAASMFPPVLRRAQAEPGSTATLATLRVLHRICRVYAGVGVAVVVFGLLTAQSLGVLGDAWLIASMVLTAAAAVMLVVLLLPQQESGLALVAEATSETAPVATDHRAGARLAMVTGVFNLLWVTVTVLMIVRPGSTTGG
ncbi:DUF2269 family protein [Streptomyces albipurpureus]|uniref:DUF2269 family protein n=1 Tax=Streptomyces albipurpureus TaxID=2897419 RepID=A0ABT0UKN4_9ACTN|nr:DUF2269 family protein [Streptomyces sp. CWNU-1]MCM2387953.1 DUF2269 family protein [Streptomyces sp. CWNU-1]